LSFGGGLGPLANNNVIWFDYKLYFEGIVHQRKKVLLHGTRPFSFSPIIRVSRTNRKIITCIPFLAISNIITIMKWKESKIRLCTVLFPYFLRFYFIWKNCLVWCI